MVDVGRWEGEEGDDEGGVMGEASIASVCLGPFEGVA